MWPYQQFRHRLVWLWRLCSNGHLTSQGRFDLLKAALLRTARSENTYFVRLPVGKVFLDGKDLKTDFHVLTDIFLTEVYGGFKFEGSVVVDVGAHKGYFAAYALLRGAKFVMCFEPEPTNLRFLRRFADQLQSKTGSIEVHHDAVVGSEGEARLHISRESWSHSVFGGHSNSHAKEIQVPARTLGGVLREVRERFSNDYLLLKIDAEGAECVLPLSESLDALRSVGEVIFEYHDFAGCGLQDILNGLRSIGFQYLGLQKDQSLHLCRNGYSGTA